jgi:hypothetical protein
MKILIVGDSWGRGEWGRIPKAEVWINYYNKLKGVDWPECPVFGFHTQLPQWVQDELASAGFDIKTFGYANGYPTVTHTGLQQYFEDAGHSVTNVSREGESISYAIAQLKQQPLDEYDHVVWFQTDPIRNLAPYTDFVERFTTIDSLLSYQLETLQQSYAELNSLGKQIHCLGGCSKLDINLISEFTNLRPVIESIPEFLLPHYIHPIIIFSNWYTLVDRQFDIDSLTKLVDLKKIQDSLVDEREFFWPDGYHPNRYGLKKVFDYLIDQLN